MLTAQRGQDREVLSVKGKGTKRDGGLKGRVMSWLFTAQQHGDDSALILSATQKRLNIIDKLQLEVTQVKVFGCFGDWLIGSFRAQYLYFQNNSLKKDIFLKALQY